MSKIKFLTTCPLCKDTHLGIQCRKPSLIVPVVTKAVCDECGSTSMLQVTIPRNKESRSQIQVTFMKVTPSQKMIVKMMEEELAKEAAKGEP